MTPSLPTPSGLQLKPEDIHALGALVAQWSIAESHINGSVLMMQILSGNNRFEDLSIKEGFSKLLIRWRSLIEKVCTQSPEHLSIGLQLSEVAKEIKGLRDAAAHWPASRSGGTALPTLIKVDFRNFPAPSKSEKQFTPESMFAASERAHFLAADVSAHQTAVVHDLFPSSIVNVGPAIDMSLGAHRFRSLE